MTVPIAMPNSRPISRTTRPGSSVPRKSLASLDKTDWRWEVSLLSDHPRSLPAPRGVRMVGKALHEKERRGAASEAEGMRHEVDLEGLISESKGKKEKRATTATTLGFDFIPNPSILVLPETKSESHTAAPSLLTQTKTLKGRVSPALSKTPTTPALIPHRQPSEDEDDEGWEHVDPLELCSDAKTLEKEQEVDADGQSDEDVIVLGELELEDELDQVESRREKKHGAKLGSDGMVGGRRGVSYAAALVMGRA